MPLNMLSHALSMEQTRVYKAMEHVLVNLQGKDQFRKTLRVQWSLNIEAEKETMFQYIN